MSSFKTKNQFSSSTNAKMANKIDKNAANQKQKDPLLGSQSNSNLAQRIHSTSIYASNAGNHSTIEGTNNTNQKVASKNSQSRPSTSCAGKYKLNQSQCFQGHYSKQAKASISPTKKQELSSSCIYIKLFN